MTPAETAKQRSERLWEKCGYAYAAYAAYAIASAADADVHAAFLRGRARWLREHPAGEP